MSRPPDDSEPGLQPASRWRSSAPRPAASAPCSARPPGSRTLKTLGTLPWWDDQLLVSRATKAFDASGALIDEAVREHLRKFLAGFVAFARGQRPA